MYKFLWSRYILVIWIFIQTRNVHGNTGRISCKLSVAFHRCNKNLIASSQFFFLGGGGRKTTQIWISLKSLPYSSSYVRYNRGVGRRLHVGDGCILSNFYLRTRKNIGRQKENKKDKRSEGNKYRIGWKPRQQEIYYCVTVGASVSLSKAGGYFLLAVTERQTVCGALGHADQIADVIDVWTQLRNSCALRVMWNDTHWN